MGRRPDWQADGRDEIGLRRPGVEDVTVQRRLSSIRSRVPATGRQLDAKPGSPCVLA